MKLKSLIAAVGTAGFVFLSTPAVADTFIRIGTGNQTGSWPPLGVQMAKIINEKVEGANATSLLGAGTANIKNLQAGRLEMGFSTTTAEAKAINGDDPFDGKQDKMMHLFNLYPIVAQFAVTDDSDIESYEDLASGSHRINANTKNSTTYAVLSSILESYGISDQAIIDAGGVVSYVGYTDGVAQMQDGNIEMTGAIGPIPHNVILQLSENPGVRLLSLEPERAQQLADKLPGYYPTIIPGGAYTGIADDVQSIGIGTNALASSELSEEMVFDVMEALFDNIDQIHALFPAAEAITIEYGPQNRIYPLHPGARRFYESRGIPTE